VRAGQILRVNRHGQGRLPCRLRQIQPPPRDAFQAQSNLPATFDFREQFGRTITTFAAILALVAFTVGAPFVGAEWNTGGMMNLLLWRPQRLTVLLTKLGALLTALLGVTVLAAAAWTAAFRTTASYRGSTANMTSGTWQSFALTGLRGLTLVLAAGVIGFALASLGRHTALALGGALGLAVVGQFGLGVVLSTAHVKFVEAWLLPTYVRAWMKQKITLNDFTVCQASYTGECHEDDGHHLARLRHPARRECGAPARRVDVGNASTGHHLSQPVIGGFGRRLPPRPWPDALLGWRR
jgi:hypothetical protein